MMECEVKVGCEGNEIGDVSVFSNENGFKGVVYSVGEEGADLSNEILEGLDSYLADIDDRLMISRMVNESVTKGMVNAVEEETAELIAVKDLEIEWLKKSLLLNKVGDNEVEMHVENGKELDSMSRTDGLREHDKMRESVDRIRVVATEQCARIKEELEIVRRCDSMKRVGSGEMLGLGGILPEKAGDNLVHVYELLDGLQNTVTVMCTQVSNDLQMSSASLRECKQQREVQGDIETKVMQSFVSGIQAESEEKFWSQNSCQDQIVNWQKKVEELSVLHKELDSLVKSLNSPETGHLISNGSLDLDSSHLKFHGNHVLPPTSFWHGNGRTEDSKISEPEALDAAQFKHLKREELVSYFNSTMRKMRRDHESIVAQMTDDYFALKREYLKKRSSSLPHWKDTNDVDMVRKKIPDVISKLDKILSENANIALLSDGESIRKLKDKVDKLISENCQLKNLLKDREKESNCLWSQISDAKEKMLQHSLVEADMMKVIENLSATIKDKHVEAEITEAMNKCFLEGLIEQTRCDFDKSNSEVQNVKEMYQIMLREGVSNDKCDFEDPYMKSLITQDIWGVLFREAIKDAQQKLRELYSKYLLENEKNISHEKKALEKETRLWQIIEDKERMGQQVNELESSLQEKEKTVRDLSTALANEREHFEHVSKELNSLKEEMSYHQTVASECAKKLESARDQLSDAYQHIEHKKIEILKLHQMLESKTEELKQIDGQIEGLRELSGERYTDFVRAEGKSKELQEQMKAVILSLQVLSNTQIDFEKRVGDSIKTNSVRLDSLSSHLKSVTGEANMLRKTVLVYKNQVKTRTADIQMAEAEVDLLGDEVETLLGLLEKIYIALDHYSPVLKHYPGIMEVLQLVRRELSGVRPKSV